MAEFFSDTSFWALAGLILFFGVLVYFKVPGVIAKQLDDRAGAIEDELESARRMREEAQELLAKYQRRQREAEEEAELILKQAKAEAKRVRTEATEEMKARLDRRTQMAELKIAQAEQQATADIRAAAANRAAIATEALLQDALTDDKRAAILKDSLDALKTRMN